MESPSFTTSTTESHATFALWQALDEGLLCTVPLLRHQRRDRPSRHLLQPRSIRDWRTRRGLYRGPQSSEAHPRRSSQRGSRSGFHARLGFLCGRLSMPPTWRRSSRARDCRPFALTGEPRPLPTEQAGLLRLRRGEIRAIFTVDLFNEGVDIPEVDTVLLLRPTESATVFLQQLGRGRLRHSPGKSVLTVLDFIGQAHQRYRFPDSLRSSSLSVVRASNSVPPLPRVSRSRRQGVRSDWTGLPPVTSWRTSGRAFGWDVSRLSMTSSLFLRNTHLRSFLEESGHDLDDVYANPKLRTLLH